MFSNPFPNAFGLDIGDLSIKLIQLHNYSALRTKPRYELVNARSISLPPGLIVNGILEKPENVRKRIQRLLQGTKRQKPITSPWVVASIPETQGFIKLIKTKTPIEQLLEEDIIEIAKHHIPFDEDNYYFNWQFIPNQEDKKTQILIGAIPKEVANSYTYLLESLGLGVVALEIEAIAISRAMITAKKDYQNESRAILDLGATRSSFIIHDNNIIQFSTSLTYSGELITMALNQKLHIDHDDAEDLKNKYGLNYNKKNKSWKIMADMTSKLIKEIKKTSEFYYSHFPESNKIKRIIMCGGGSNMKKLDKILSSKLKTITHPGKPWKNLFNRKKINMPDSESLKYATAIGLALRAADNPFLNNDII